MVKKQQINSDAFENVDGIRSVAKIRSDETLNNAAIFVKACGLCLSLEKIFIP